MGEKNPVGVEMDEGGILPLLKGGVDSMLEEGEIDAIAFLEERFKSLGGTGCSALDFLVRGQDDDEWVRMNEAEQQMWLDLCGLYYRQPQKENIWLDD
ncbi:MAG: hypothetical protein V1897_02450 [Pseudomonadota bacterium]